MSDELEAEVRENQAKIEGKDPRFAELERLATELHGEGKDFRIEHGRIIQSKHDRDKDRETALDLGKHHVRLGVLSDPHLGSKFEQRTALHEFYRYGDEQKVDAFINCGDLTQGSNKMHLGMEHEVHAHGAEAQGGYAVATYPKSRRKGVKTYIIGGNHDASFKKDGGINIVRTVCNARPDMVYLGEDAAYLTLNGIRAYVMHPDGGGSYAKSYKPQKLAESLPVEKDVRLLLMGHYHVYGAFKERNTHTFMVPCFQSQYGWLARKGLHPDIGGLIIDLWMDDSGRLARVAHEFVSFPALEDDWDHEVSAEVNRGWSSKGLAVD